MNEEIEFSFKLSSGYHNFCILFLMEVGLIYHSYLVQGINGTVPTFVVDVALYLTNTHIKTPIELL